MVGDVLIRWFLDDLKVLVRLELVEEEHPVMLATVRISCREVARVES